MKCDQEPEKIYCNACKEVLGQNYFEFWEFYQKAIWMFYKEIKLEQGQEYYSVPVISKFSEDDYKSLYALSSLSEVFQEQIEDLTSLKQIVDCKVRASKKAGFKQDSEF